MVFFQSKCFGEPCDIAFALSAQGLNDNGTFMVHRAGKHQHPLCRNAAAYFPSVPHRSVRHKTAPPMTNSFCTVSHKGSRSD